MNNLKSLPALLVVLCALNTGGLTSVQAAVPLGITASGTITHTDAHSIEVDGKTYPIEAGSPAAAQLSALRVGQKITLDITRTGADHRVRTLHVTY